MTRRSSAFETEMKKCLVATGQVAWIHRPTDYPGLPNPIDLLGCLYGGRALFCECKTKKNPTSINFGVFTDEQWTALCTVDDAGSAVYAAFEFYRRGDRGRALLVPFRRLREARNELERKSWTVEMLFSIGSELEKLPDRWRFDGSL